jgi:hypothetical protein
MNSFKRLAAIAVCVAALAVTSTTGAQRTEHLVVDVATDTTTVHAGRAFLYGIYVNTALSAHALPIENDTAAVITLPASLAAGTMVTFPGIEFDTSLIVDSNDAATGNITVIYVIP